MSDITTISEVDTMDDVQIEIDLKYIIAHQNEIVDSAEDTPEQWIEQTRWGEKIRHLENLNTQCRYREAVRFGREFRHEFDSASDVVRGEFLVHHAKALIYTSVTERAIKVLKEVIAQLECGQTPEDAALQGDENTEEGRRRNLVLGLAHNHLGYAYWINLGRYRLARQELHAALPYFAASGLIEEYATTCDNIGRVLARLGQLGEGKIWIEEGLHWRLDTLTCESSRGHRATHGEPKLGHRDKCEYRVALSYISMAVLHLRSGKLDDAHKYIVKALGICERLGALRGIGLACIVLGSVLRQIAGSDSVNRYGMREAWLDQAAMYSRRGEKIFERDVFEPVRLIEACSELERTYRTRADLLRQRWPDSPPVWHYHGLAV